jgi:hypothetical protein
VLPAAMMGILQGGFPEDPACCRAPTLHVIRCARHARACVRRCGNAPTSLCLWRAVRQRWTQSRGALQDAGSVRRGSGWGRGGGSEQRNGSGGQCSVLARLVGRKNEGNWLARCGSEFRLDEAQFVRGPVTERDGHCFTTKLGSVSHRWIFVERSGSVGSAPSVYFYIGIDKLESLPAT